MKGDESRKMEGGGECAERVRGRRREREREDWEKREEKEGSKKSKLPTETQES